MNITCDRDRQLQTHGHVHWLVLHLMRCDVILKQILSVHPSNRNVPQILHIFASHHNASEDCELQTPAKQLKQTHKQTKWISQRNCSAANWGHRLSFVIVHLHMIMRYAPNCVTWNRIKGASEVHCVSVSAISNLIGISDVISLSHFCGQSVTTHIASNEMFALKCMRL